MIIIKITMLKVNALARSCKNVISLQRIYIKINVQKLQFPAPYSYLKAKPLITN